MDFDRLPKLGVGMVYWHTLEPLLTTAESLIDYIEIEPQTLWYELDRCQQPYQMLPATVARLQSLTQPKIIHSVGMPVGVSHPVTQRQLHLLQQTIQDLGALWASEHLNFNHGNNHGETFHTGFLLPPLQTAAGVKVAVDSIRQLAGQLTVPLAVETGVSYLRPRTGEMPDGLFVSAVTEAADCGILLDLHNIWTNQRNGRQSVAEFLAQIPLDRVLEVHMAGGEEYDGFWLDSHSQALSPELLELAAQVLPQLPNLKAVTLEVMPNYIEIMGLESIEQQLIQLHELWVQCSRPEAVILPRPFTPQDRSFDDLGNDPWSLSLTPEVWTNALGIAAIGQSQLVAEKSADLCSELEQDPGLAVIQHLIATFRSGMVIDALELSARLIILHQDADQLRRLLQEFWQLSPPQMFGSAEARDFAQFLALVDLDVPYLPAVLSYEQSLIQVVRTGKPVVWHCDVDPDRLLGALRNWQLPANLPSGSWSIELTL